MKWNLSERDFISGFIIKDTYIILSKSRTISQLLRGLVQKHVMWYDNLKIADMKHIQLLSLNIYFNSFGHEMRLN